VLVLTKHTYLQTQW